MTSGQKIAFSLLTAMGLFAVFVLTLHSTLFKELETKFYTQSKIEENTGQLNKLSESYDVYISEILTQLETGENAWVKEPAVRSYYLQNPSEADVNQRRALTEKLFSTIPALNGVRILDKNGRNVHFSTYDTTDVLKQTGITKIYKNYPDVVKDADELSFEVLSSSFDEKQSKILLEEARNRIIITVPYFWMDEVYAGQCLFYFNFFDIEKELTARDALSIGESLTMYADPDDFTGGYVVGIPAGNKKAFSQPVQKYWKTRKVDNLKPQIPEKLLEMEDGRYWVILTSTNDTRVKISGVYTSDIFEISTEIKYLIYICVFISILLIVFLVFSIKRDPEQVLKKRIKKIQYGIIKEYIDSKEKVEWAHVSRQLKSRKKDLSQEILKSLKVRSRKKRKELDQFLENNWNEIFSIFDDKAAATDSSKAASTPAGTGVAGVGELTGASLSEIRKILEEVLQNTKLNVTAVETVAPAVKKVKKTPPAVVEEVEDIEEIEEIADAEEVLDEVEEIADAEEVLDEVEEIEDAEEVVEEAEEIDDAEEVLDEVEEIDEAEEVLDEVEEIADAEEVIEEVEEIDDAEEVLDEVEEIADAEEVIEEAEEIEDAEEVLEEAEEIDDAEEVVEEAEEIDDAEEVLDEVEEIADAEEVVEEAEEIDEAEEVLDEVEEIEDAEELDDDIEVLEDAEVPPVPKFLLNMDLILQNQPVYIYKPSKETYFKSEDFATVENYNAEELGCAPHISLHTVPGRLEISNFEIYPLNKITVVEEDIEDIVESPDQIEEGEDITSEAAVQMVEEQLEVQAQEPVEDIIEELTEDLGEPLPYYSMTNFAENLTNDTPVLESATVEDNGAIVEKDGVFSISDNLELGKVEQNLDFKALVDSIL